MAMARSDFIAQLEAMGFEVYEAGEGKIYIPYVIPIGPQIGKAVKLGFMAFDDFPANPPGCLHISPRLLPLNSNSGEHPFASVHNSPFGDDWQYWSRPISGWSSSKHTAGDVISHINRLFQTL